MANRYSQEQQKLTISLKILSGLKKHGPHHIVGQATEHSAVLKPIQFLVEQGCEASILPVDSQGYVDLDQIKALHYKTYPFSFNHAYK